jgi:transcriptional regulator
MYVPPHFAETRTSELQRLIVEHPLGILVLAGPAGLDANHLPFELDPHAGEHGRLLAHAGDAYISPNWYPSQHETQRQVPTWNYRVVHVHGRIRIHDDERFVRGVVARLTHDHETRTDQAQPWRMRDAPRDYLERMLAAIVGIEIEISQMVGKWKLSQNREERDRLTAAGELERRGDTVTAAAMRAAGADQP